MHTRKLRSHTRMQIIYFDIDLFINLHSQQLIIKYDDILYKVRQKIL